MDVLVEVVSRHLAPLLGNFWDSAFFWRSVAIVGLLALVSALAKRKWLAAWLLKMRGREHDVALFKKMDEMLSERTLDRFLNLDLYNAGCRYEDIKVVSYFCGDFIRIENEYLDGTLKDRVGDFIRDLHAVDHFVAIHFFRTAAEGWLKLYPDDRMRAIDPTKRNAYVRELHGLTATAWDSYRRFRRTVKARLHL